MSQRKSNRTKRGTALIGSFVVLSLLAVASVSYTSSSTETVRASKRMTMDVQATNLCEAGIQDILRALWRPFKQQQIFTQLDTNLSGATTGSPRSAMSGTVSGVGSYSAGVINYATVPGNAFVRMVTVRAVGWIDQDNDGQLDIGEPSKTVDVTARFELTRSQVFDYTYFVNNYGWMDGFNGTDLVVNGDMRANGNFNFLNGSPTVNGSVFANNNDKLVPMAVGLVNSAPIKMAQTTYGTWAPSNPAKLSGESNAAYALRVAAYQDMIAARRRQGYNSLTHGSLGSTTFEENRDFVFRSDASLVNDRPAGAIIGDSTGLKSWTRTGTSAATTSLLDTQRTREIIMPDLSDLNRYIDLSTNYRDTKATFLDGTPNPNYNQGAWVEMWNSSTNSYQRVSTNGVVNGSVVLIGTDAKPIRIHGPVTVTQDVVIKGTVSGQGTLYTGRNTHIVGGIKYASGPDFRGGAIIGTDAMNEKRDILGLAARGSVIMGNPTSFTNSSPLQYMTPVNPPTKTVGTYGRYDEDGNWIPAYDAMAVDSTGRRRYQSVVPDSTINSIAEGVNQIDAIIYTNFVGGGNIGTSGGGVTINGTIISRDEAMVTWSLPIIMNYDNRIREREVNDQPLVDLNLPRSPALLRSTWQDRGFIYRSSY
ncbi:MAG: hypothetical protein JNK63_07215 [Chthonomonas sp.]|nr:hypothetical protein [Chthonomonas sp.]